MFSRVCPSTPPFTPGACSKPEQLKATDPGACMSSIVAMPAINCFEDVLDARYSFVGRVKDDTAFTPIKERPLTAEAQAAGVVRDVLVSKLGTDHHKDYLRQTDGWCMVRRLKSNGEVDVR